MPALAPIVVKDRAATPTNHTFKPSGGNEIPEFRESDGVSIGDKVITVSKRKAGTNHKIRIRVVVPQVATATVEGISDPRVVRTAYADIQLTFGDKSMPQERKDMLGFISSMFSGVSQPIIDGICVDLEHAY